MEVQWHSRRRRARLSNGESYRKLKPLYTQYTVWKYKARGEQTLPSSREISENLVPQQVLSLLEREVLSYNTQLLDTYTHHRLSAARSSCRGTFFTERNFQSIFSGQTCSDQSNDRRLEYIIREQTIWRRSRWKDLVRCFLEGRWRFNSTGNRSKGSFSYTAHEKTTVQYSTVQYNTAQYSTVQYSTV